MKNIKSKLFGLTITLFLFACGGGGGDSSSSTPANVSAAGVWQGISSSGYVNDLIVLPDNRFYNIYGVGTVGGGLAVVGFDYGTATTSGSSLSGPFTEYVSDGKAYAGSMAATVVANTSITGTSSYANGIKGTFAFYPLGQYAYNTPAVLSSITGQWSGTLLTGPSATILVSTAGAIAGTSSGCVFSGTVSPDPSVNYFNVSLTFGAGSCALPGQTVTGIALNYKTNVATTQLVIAVTNTANTIGTAFFAQR